MKLAQLYNTAPSKRLNVGSTQFGPSKREYTFGPTSSSPPPFMPASKGRSILGRKKTYPVQ